MVSTSPVFYARKNILRKCFNAVAYDEYDSVEVGNDVWIGINAFVKGGIKIGDGAIIGAHAVVTKDVEPFTIVAGNPARIIGKRFNDETIEKLLKTKWWDFQETELSEKAGCFNNPDEFLKKTGV
jgi:acetyltransferase-like isoleucine patch superfamily enzyme